MATDELKQVAPFGGRNDDPRRQRMLAHLRRGPVVRQIAVPKMPSLPQRPDSPEAARAYNAAASKVQALFDCAERTLKVNPLQREIAATKAAYVKASTTLAADLQLPDYLKAQRSLASKAEAARTVMAEKIKAEVANRKREHQQDASAFTEMAPVLGDVKRSNVPLGMARNIAKNHKNAEPEFKQYLVELQALEDAKAGVDPAERVDPRLAATLIDQCRSAVAAAQAYLAHVESLGEPQQGSPEIRSRRQHCEEGIKSASQYALAMEIDRAGPPAENAPWDRVTQLRVAGAMAQFRYEQGNKKLQGLDDDGGGKGASDSYWLRSKSIAEVGSELGTGKAAKGSREFIFKPADGEDAPVGMKESHQKGAGSAKEALASSNAKLFAAQTGIDLGVPETTVVSMGQHAIKNGDLGSPALVGSAQQLAAGASTQVGDLPHDAFAKIKPKEVQKIALLDIMSLSMDRHGGNIMVDTTDPDDPKMIPIDHGATLPNRQAFSNTKVRMGGILMEKPPSIVNALLKIPSAFEPFDPEIVAGLDLLDPAAIETDMQAQLGAMDQVHPGLDAANKVGADSLQMSKRSMMFLKKAAKVMSPAEVQLALTQHGEELFDAPDDEATIDDIADQIIAKAAPRKAAYQEVLGLTPDQLDKVIMFLAANGWAKTEIQAAELVMADPVAAMALFKGKSRNAAPLPTTPFETPSGGPKLQIEQTEVDALKRDFPECKYAEAATDGRRKEFILCYRAFRALGTKTDLDSRVRAIGGTAPKSPIAGLQILKAWAALQTPEYQSERAQLPLDGGGKSCADLLKDLMEEKAKKIVVTQAADARSRAAGALDAGAMASAYANELLTDAKAILDGFSDAGAAAPLLAQWRLKSAQLAQGPAQNQPAQAFASELEQEARALYRQVNAAGLEDVRIAGAAAILPFRGLRAPTDVAMNQAMTESFQAINGLQASTLGAGNLHAAYASLRKLQANAQAMLAIAVPIATAQPNDQPTAPQRPTTPTPMPPRPSVAPLAIFDWDQEAASAVKKQAVKLKLFKDKDTGMTDALKTINKARLAADDLSAALPTAKKIALYKAAEQACTDFSRFINGKLRGLSKDPAWTGYCDSAAKETEGQFNKFKALRVILE